MAGISAEAAQGFVLHTEILPVDVSKIITNGKVASSANDWELQLVNGSQDAANLRRAAEELQNSDIPVAFPTETVYGLGADATRSSAVRGIYKAKQRPSDNPLIVHVHSLEQLRGLLRPGSFTARQNGAHQEDSSTGSQSKEESSDPIPAIYRSLIGKFWPGPLTLIMPDPPNSILAREVTAGLPTFGVRMPRSLHALALLKLSNVPLAAPSANASSKPSPTEAGHVLYDLKGRISTIIDGGPCEVGVESTVVDGLSDPPSILRPGGVSIEELRMCPGWESVTVGYKDTSESDTQPRAPGMKYRHYSPKAPVILYESGEAMPTHEEILSNLSHNRSVGVIRTRSWLKVCGLTTSGGSNHDAEIEKTVVVPDSGSTAIDSSERNFEMHAPLKTVKAHRYGVDAARSVESFALWDIDLGTTAEDVAKGLFSALRELDQQDVDVIFVEGIEDGQGNVSAAVMNRLRKAAEVRVRKEK